MTCSCSKKVAEVGDNPITGKDIAFRAQVSEVYYPNSGQDYVGLTQLIKGYLNEIVLESLGHKVDKEALEQEARRIDSNTKAAAVLEKVKSVYGLNRNAYLNTFVRVVYAERVLYNEIFLKSGKIHQEQRNNTEDFLQVARKSPQSFNDLAQKHDLEPRRLYVSKQDGINPYGEKDEHRPPPSGAGQEQAERLIEMIKQVQPGQVCPRVMEWQEGYQVIKFVKQEGEDYVVDSVSIPKRTFDDWFWEQASFVPVKIYDNKLKDELLQKVGWAKNLKLK